MPTMDAKTLARLRPTDDSAAAIRSAREMVRGNAVGDGSHNPQRGRQTGIIHRIYAAHLQLRTGGRPGLCDGCDGPDL
jgi:hypothetical protein